MPCRLDNRRENHKYAGGGASGIRLSILITAITFLRWFLDTVAAECPSLHSLRLNRPTASAGGEIACLIEAGTSLIDLALLTGIYDAISADRLLLTTAVGEITSPSERTGNTNLTLFADLE